MGRTWKRKAVALAQRAGGYIQTMGEVGMELSRLPAGAGPLHYTAAAASLTRRLSDVAINLVRDENGWLDVFNNPCFDEYLVSLLRALETGTEIPRDSLHRPGLSYYEVAGAEVCVAELDSGGYRLRCRKGDREATQVALGRYVWESLGPRIRMSCDRHENMEMQPWKAEALRSDAGDELLQEFDRSRGTRSVLLYGPSGCGKSCMARYVASQLGGPTLVHDGRMPPNLIEFAVTVLRPTVLVVDDFDRHPESAAMLDTLEFLRASDSVVIATANDVTLLDGAAMRPGRFDLLLEVKSLGADVQERLLEGIPEPHRSEVEEWEAAYLGELQARVRAAESAREVTRAVENLRRHRELQKSAKYQRANIRIESR